MGYFQAVQNVGKGHHLAVRHVGVPILACIAQTNGFTVGVDFVGQDHHLGQTRHLVHIGHIDFQLSKALGKLLELQGRQCLPGITQNAIPPQGLLQSFEVHV